MVEYSNNPRSKAGQLEIGDEFRWTGEGWTNEGSRPPNRATVQTIRQGQDYEGEDATVIEIEGVQGGKAELYLYDDREEVILFGSAEVPEEVVGIQLELDEA